MATKLPGKAGKKVSVKKIKRKAVSKRLKKKKLTKSGAAKMKGQQKCIWS